MATLRYRDIGCLQHSDWKRVLVQDIDPHGIAFFFISIVDILPCASKERVCGMSPVRIVILPLAF
jgi:hypothetical protein